MKRAIFVTTSDRAGGAERVVATLARGLSQRPEWGVDLYVLCGRDDQNFVARTLSGTCVRVIYGPSVRERFSVIPFVKFLLTANYDFGFSTHVHTNAVMCTMARFRRSIVARLVTRESTVLFDRFEGVRRRFYQLCYSLYGAQHLIVAQSEYMADHLRMHLPARVRARVRVVPNPVDLSQIQMLASIPLDKDDEQMLAGRINIAFCGRLVEVKRPELAVLAMAALKSSAGSIARLVFIGDGPLRPQVERLVAELNLADDVVFLGQRENPYQILASCTYGLLTSSMEGFPNAVLEMMACGVASVVTTNCAGDLDKLADVIVVDDDRPEEIAARLAEAVHDGLDHSFSYRKTVEMRLVDHFLDQVIRSDA